jgi:hypothetical protein
MAASKRRCATCRFYQDSGMSGNGWCTHPDRQVSSDVRILVRKAELACRNAWGSDLWEDASADAAAPGEQRHAPVEMPLPASPVSYDDEVTSVVNADQHAPSRAAAPDDEVVEQSIISFDDPYPDDDQDERRDLLYRDSRSAIERARQRALNRRQQPVIDPEDRDEDDILLVEDDHDRTSVSLEAPVFEPDDFVEEEAPASTSAVDEHDDALISEGVRTLSPRARRLRRFREDNTPPKDPTVAKVEPDQDDVELVLPPSAAPERGRFDSIPEISADIDIPLLRHDSSAQNVSAPPPRDDEGLPSSYERALKRAHALNAAARAEKNVERRRASITAPARACEPEENDFASQAAMPDLPEDDHVETPVRPVLAAPRAERAAPDSRPRMSTGRARHISPQPEEERARLRPTQARATRPNQDARRSWWRGARTRQEIEAVAQQADMHDVSAPARGASDRPAFEELNVELPVRDESRAELPDHDIEPSAGPERVSFDLAREDGMESFRDRLFAASSPADEPSVPDASTRIAAAAAPRERGPITMSRRQHRPITPAARERYRAEREPARPERREPVAETPRPTRQPGPQARAERMPQPRQSRIEPDELLSEPQDAWYEPEPVPDFDVRNYIEPDTELLDMTIMIAPDVQRACATCRNYRPSEQAGRGWCTNSWAFTHRQMVNETDLACNSTIGCWWLPADEEVWLTDVEVAEEATPRVDRLVAHLSPERRAVGN